jgi:hypothetical protein
VTVAIDKQHGLTDGQCVHVLFPLWVTAVVLLTRSEDVSEAVHPAHERQNGNDGRDLSPSPR